MAVDVLHHDHRGVDDDAEVDRADGQQIGGFAAQEEHGQGEQQRQRHVDGHDQRGADVAEEQQQHHRDQAHAGQQVFPNRAGGDVDQVGAVVIGLDLHARQQAAGGFVELLDQGVDVVQGGQRLVALAQQHDALDDFVLVVPDAPALGVEHFAALGVAQRQAPHHVAEARLVAHHHALLARRRTGPQRSAFDHVVDAHRDVVGGAEHDLADLADAAFFLGPEVVACGDGVFHAHRGFHGVLAHAQQPQRADHVGGAALDDVVAPDVGIVRGDGVLELLQGDAVALHPRRVGMDLVAFHGPAVAGHVGHARQAAEQPLQRVVLQRLEVVGIVDVASRGVLGANQHVAEDLAGGRPRGDIRGYPGRKVGQSSDG